MASSTFDKMGVPLDDEVMECWAFGALEMPALLNKVGHLALHIREGGYQTIFDDTDVPDASPVEDEAD